MATSLTSRVESLIQQYTREFLQAYLAELQNLCLCGKCTLLFLNVVDYTVYGLPFQVYLLHSLSYSDIFFVFSHVFFWLTSKTLNTILSSLRKQLDIAEEPRKGIFS